MVEPSTPFGDFTNDKLRGICQEFNLKIGTRKQMLKKIEELKPKINFEFCDLETKKIQEICLSRGINPHQKRNRLLQALDPEKTKKGNSSTNRKKIQENQPVHTAEPIQDHRLMGYLDRWSTTVKNQLQLKKLICIYIYFKLRRNDDFADEGKIKKTFFLIYGDILQSHYKKILYPNREGDANYIRKKITQEIWETIWSLSDKYQV
jgi:hypothetical protein